MGNVEPDTSVTSGVTVAVAARRNAGSTPWTGTDIVQLSPGRSCGGAATSPASVAHQPNGPATIRLRPRPPHPPAHVAAAVPPARVLAAAPARVLTAAPATPPAAARAPLRAALLALLLVALLAGCASGDDWSRPRAEPTATGTLHPGFVGSDATPAPESTIRPAPGSWDGIGPTPGYRVVLLTSGDDEPTNALVTAVREWARAERADLRTLVAHAPADLVPTIADAMAMGPDLIVSAGNDLIDPLALVTPNHLDQQFLVVGAELAEPTVNVTAVDWSGASFRGEGLGTSSTYDPASFTAERCAAAVRAGVAAVLGGVTGIVVWLD